MTSPIETSIFFGDLLCITRSPGSPGSPTQARRHEDIINALLAIWRRRRSCSSCKAQGQEVVQALAPLEFPVFSTKKSRIDGSNVHHHKKRPKNDQQKYGKIWYYVGFEWFWMVLIHSHMTQNLVNPANLALGPNHSPLWSISTELCLPHRLSTVGFTCFTKHRSWPRCSWLDPAALSSLELVLIAG